MTQKTEQSAPHAPLSAGEFGQLLRCQREQKGLSIGEVSERLKLPARQIEALEKGNYEVLPEPVFVRGFLRSYGRFLDLEESQLDAYLSHFTPPNPIHKTHTSSGLSYAGSEIKKPFPTWIFGVLAAIGIGYGIYAWQSKTQTENAQQANHSTITAGDSATTVSASNLNHNNVIVKPMTASDISASQMTTASGNNSIQAASAAVPAVSGELVINARYRTMLTVTNASGEILINQIVPGRSEHRFATGAPFEVRLGYAVGSTATFGGSEIDIDAARRGAKIAVFNAGGDTDTASSAP